MSNSKFDIRDFRSALGQFPTGVTVITALDDKGQPIGCTASSFNSVSIDPALVLWSVDKSAFSAEIFRNAEYFAVNVLSEEQVDISNRFAGRGEDKFKGVSYQWGLGGAPLFEGCGAQFECKTWNVYDGGDHLIIVGEVIKYNHDDSLTPLVFSRGSYAITAQHPQVNPKNDNTGNEFLDDYLLYLLNSTISKYRKELYPKLTEGCDIKPEQWRVLTVLSDTDELTIVNLAAHVVQPANELNELLAELESKNIISVVDKSVKLTGRGAALQKDLFSLAHQHESEVVKGLTSEQVHILKSALKSILSSV